MLRAYKAPPIVEAAIELRFSTPFAEKEILKIGDRLAKHYQNTSTDLEVEFQVKLEKGDATPHIVGTSPIRKLSSHDEAHFTTIKSDRVIVSELAPYCGWDDFFARFLRDFEVISKGIAGKKLSRIGVRYVNRIDIPQDENSSIVEYEKFLSTHLKLPNILDPLEFYTWRIQKSFPEKDFSAMVFSEVVKPEVPRTSAFLLDIDVFRFLDNALGGVDVGGILSEMRELKNEIFEASVTEHAREIFR